MNETAIHELLIIKHEIKELNQLAAFMSRNMNPTLYNIHILVVDGVYVSLWLKTSLPISRMTLDTIITLGLMFILSILFQLRACLFDMSNMA